MNLIVPIDNEPAPSAVSRSTIYLPLIFSGQLRDPCTLYSPVDRFMQLMKEGKQGRPSLTCNSALMNGAQAKAKDMAVKGYFAHIAPDGLTPNKSAHDFGCGHPYDDDGNQIESSLAGTWNADAAYEALIRSPRHRVHIEGEDFFSDQIDFGIGYYELAGSPYTFYWVVWTAPCS
jgi:uncharacterized protein YkwD